MVRKSILLTLLAVNAILFIAPAQSFYAVRRDRSLIFHVGTGTSTYFGELQNPGDFIDAKPNLNFGLQHFFTPRISGRAEITWFQLSGDDSKADGGGRNTRNLSFLANNYEISVTGAINFFPLGKRFYQRPKINFYGFIGFGMLYMNPTAELNGERHALQPLQTEGVKYSKTQPVVPYGLGVKAKIGPFMNIVMEGGYRLTFTDYIDDVSTVHVDKTGWDPLRVALSDRRPELTGQAFPVGSTRGNPKMNDGYFLFNAKIEYYLPHNFIFGNDTKRAYKKKRKSIKRRR
jgi:hypothetical protein